MVQFSMHELNVMVMEMLFHGIVMSFSSDSFPYHRSFTNSFLLIVTADPCELLLITWILEKLSNLPPAELCFLIEKIGEG